MLKSERHSYGAILADPPWDYRNFTSSVYGAAHQAYGDGSKELMTLEDIAAIPVPKWSAPAAHLFLWTTWPKLDEGLRLLELWGFEYVTGIPWVKTTPKSAEIYCGIGFWTQSASEVLLIGRKGKTKRKKDSPIVQGLLLGDELQFYSPRRKPHSTKPHTLHEWIHATVEGPYLELFARRPREGWMCYGHDLGWHLDKRGATWSGEVKYKKGLGIDG